MRRLLNRIFLRYGTPIKVGTTSGTYVIRGFVQHTATSARKYLLPEYTSLGEIPRGYYLMLLPLYEVQVGQQLMYNGKWYIIRRMERVWLGSEAIYDWCLCEERGENDKWGR